MLCCNSFCAAVARGVHSTKQASEGVTDARFELDSNMTKTYNDWKKLKISARSSKSGPSLCVKMSSSLSSCCSR